MFVNVNHIYDLIFYFDDKFDGTMPVELLTESASLFYDYFCSADKQLITSSSLFAAFLFDRALAAVTPKQKRLLCCFSFVVIGANLGWPLEKPPLFKMLHPRMHGTFSSSFHCTAPVTPSFLNSSLHC